jgi:hypothetical protein
LASIIVISLATPTSSFASRSAQPPAARHDHRQAGIERRVAMGAMRDAATFVLFLIGRPSLPLFRPVATRWRARVLLAVGRLDANGPVPATSGDFTEAELDSGDRGVVGQARGEVGPFDVSSKSCSSPRLISAPPGASLSRQKTLRPARAASVAVVRPAGPAPMTMTS